MCRAASCSHCSASFGCCDACSASSCCLSWRTLLCGWGGQRAGVEPGTRGCAGKQGLLHLLGFPRLLCDLGDDLVFRRGWRRGGGQRVLHWSGLGGSRGGRQATLTLLLLQLLQALVDGLAHIVLHLLEVLERN